MKKKARVKYGYRLNGESFEAALGWYEDLASFNSSKRGVQKAIKEAKDQNIIGKRVKPVIFKIIIKDL